MSGYLHYFGFVSTHRSIIKVNIYLTGTTTSEGNSTHE
jgi:hypothetical protein